jgi:nitrogen fixation NifU-like protein
MDTNYYKSQLLTHYKNPIGSGEITVLHQVANGVNPLCGDEINVGVILDGSKIKDIKFGARACSICIASSSIMVDILIGKEVSKVKYFHEQIKKLLTSEIENEDIDEPLKPLLSVVSTRSRHKCVCLAWEALQQAITQ